MDMHPDISEAFRLFGCHHTHGGRVLGLHRTGVSHDEQETRLADEGGWRHEHTRFTPVRFAIEGARAYNAKVGLGDPHQHEYANIRQDRDTVRNTGRSYDALPLHQDHALPHFEAMRHEVGNQFHHLTHTMGVNVHTVDHDPYANVHDMIHDVSANKRLKVLGTHVTGGHPFFSDGDNDKFRAVHDFFGHAATGRDFSRHGEQAAFLAHARMFSHHALPAMTSETKGQNTSLILNGDFGPQKVAVLPKEHWDHSWPEHTARLMRLAESMTPEDIVRMELGRQHVHDVDDGASARKLCVPHMQHALSTQQLRHSQNGLQVGPQHEGQCEHCLQGQPNTSTPEPWNALPGGGLRPQQAQERRVTHADEGDEWGAGYSEGRWPHRSLKPHEQFGPFVPGIQSLNRLAVPLEGSPKVPNAMGLRFLAHDSGDGETIFHCFAGETRYWTREGIQTLADTVGTTQWVLSNTGNGGSWVEAKIHDFGVQPLMKVTLRRNKRVKVVYATPEHRWLVRTRANRNENRVVLTRDLQADHRLAWLLPRTAIARSTPSPFGIAHGVTYGDGTRAARGSVLNLWGEKDAQLLRYFAESRQEPIKTEQGVDGMRVLDLPAFFKARPSVDESIPYLYGWLAGYFAADGTVTQQGQVVMYAASREDLEFYQLVAMRLGIGSYDIVERKREGFGEQRDLCSLQLIGSTLRPEFFLTRDHRQRYEAVIERGNAERIGWTVDSVEETDRVESVYCAVVPEHENFVLDGLINTMNCPFCGSGQVIARSDGTVECEFCSTAFTVQVQPQMPAFPQTIDGVPQQVPGMPAGGQDANVPPGAAPGGDPTDPDAPEDGQQEDGSDNPFADDADSGGDDSGSDDDKPAFLKGSGLLYRTAAGHALDELRFMRHLALQDPARRERVLAQIRAENGG